MSDQLYSDVLAQNLKETDPTGQSLTVVNDPDRCGQLQGIRYGVQVCECGSEFLL